MNFTKTVVSMAAAFSLMLGLGACGDNAEQTQHAASMISDHYKQNPPKRDWQVLSVYPDIENNKLMVQIQVTSEQDVNKIKSLSRMDQLAVAKLACPMMFKELRDSLDSTRVWVELRANNKSLITSICPK